IRAPILPPPDPPIDRESCRRSKPQIRRPGCNRNATVAGKVATIGRCLGVTSAAPRTRSAPPPLAGEGGGGGGAQTLSPFWGPLPIPPPQAGEGTLWRDPSYSIHFSSTRKSWEERHAHDRPEPGALSPHADLSGTTADHPRHLEDP